MTYVFILIYWLPTWVEGWLDRKGETKKGKVKDSLWLVVVALTIAGVAWWSGYEPLPVIGLMLMWRICTFDYIVHAFLKRYSENHGHINIWKYSGKTALTDRIVSKIPWEYRLLIRLTILCSVVLLYLLFPHK